MWWWRESTVSSFSAWVHLPFCPTNEKDIKEVQATKKEAGNGTGHSWECEQEGSLQLLKSSLFQYKFLIVGSVFLCTGQNWVAQSLINTKRIYISMCGPFLGLKFRPVPCLLENHFFIIILFFQCSIFFTMHSMTHTIIYSRLTLLTIYMGLSENRSPRNQVLYHHFPTKQPFGGIPDFQTHPKKLRLVD